jgi:hypothetical protein
MKTNIKALASLALALAVSAGNAQTASKKPNTANADVQSQIDALRTDLQGQIQSLKQQLAEKDAQLQQAQQAAQAAQAAAQDAQQVAHAVQSANSENTTMVASLQGAVSYLKSSNPTPIHALQGPPAQAPNWENPDAIHFKGITLSPTGSFLAAETVWRSKATGADIPTAFNSLPLSAANQAQLSEFYGTGRQSRVALLAEGKAKDFTMRGYYEADWLGTGITSNDNQSNSYVMRQRQLWAQVQKSKWLITGGQMWSLVTETTAGMNNRTEATPQVIDPNYVPGFNWERQYAFRVVNEIVPKTVWLAASVENPETLNLGGTVPANLLLGGPGNQGGNFNGGGTITFSGNLPTVGAAANYSYNLAPDLIAKVAFEPKFGGHFELYGLARFFQYRNYVGYKSTYTQGGTVTVCPPGATNGVGCTVVVTPPTTTITYTSAYNDQTVGGGIGASGRYPLLNKKLTLGLKGQWGDGVNRYGDSTLADATANYLGQLKLLHSYSALGTIEAHATPRLDLYAYWGVDGTFRNYSTSPTGGQFGYGNYNFSNKGCETEPAPVSAFGPNNPSSCAANTRSVWEFTAGAWYDFYRGPMGRLRSGVQYGYAVRDVFSGAVGTTPQATNNMFWTSFRYYLP